MSRSQAMRWLAALSLPLAGGALAAAASPDVGRSPVPLEQGAVRIARIGPLAIDAATFRRRAARVSELAWAPLGASWPERRRRFLDEVLVPEALLTIAAQRDAPAVLPAGDVALARALQAELALVAASAAPSDDEVLAYYTREREQLAAPRGLTLWRILLPTEADARAVIAELTPPTAASFSRVARERSLDRATAMRAGNLGPVGADGQTRAPELRVSPALFAAADRIADGQLVPDPVPEGERFAVVWRRASHPTETPTLAAATPWIRARLAEERAASERRALLDALRREHLGEYHAERAGAYEPRFSESSVPLQRAGPAGRVPARPVPAPTDRGLR